MGVNRWPTPAWNGHAARKAGFQARSPTRHFRQAESLLMDRETLLAHRPMWVTEPDPCTESLTRLTDAEYALFKELVRGTHGERVRLEQERMGFGWVRNRWASE